jgi:flagellar hook-length control protein FliK
VEGISDKGSSGRTSGEQPGSAPVSSGTSSHGAGSTHGQSAAKPGDGALRVGVDAATTQAGQPTSVIGQSATLPATSAGAEAAATPPTLAGGVGMQEMIDSIRATIQLAARQGLAQARIALQPDALGHISIRLSQTSDGLIARVSAETPAAAQALAEGHAELHQSLSSLGVTLLRLDIGSFGQSQAGAGHEQRSAGDPHRATGSGDQSSNSEETDESPASGAIEGAATPVAIAGGELVDVLA